MKNSSNKANAFLINEIEISHNPYDHVLVALYSANPLPQLEGQLEAYGVFPFNSSRKQRKAVIEAYLIFKKNSEEMTITSSRDNICDETNDYKGKLR